MITVTNHHRFAGEHITNALQGFFRITFLNVTDEGIDYRADRKNHQRN